MTMRFNNFAQTAASSQLLIGAENSLKAMGLLDELKGIVIDQQRAIRERDAKIGTLQQQYDTLNASYWTVLQRLRSYDHIFSLLTKPMKTNGENGTTENESETKTESESLKTEEKPTHSTSSKTEPTHSPTTQASLLASMAEAQNGLENKSNLISETIKNFGLDRFTGVSMMNMNGLLNGTKPPVVTNGTASNPAQKNQVALPRCNDVNVIGKTGEGNKPYICKVCGRRFTDRSNCIKHQFIHTGLKPFECPHCGKRFRRKDHLNSHSKSQHGEEAFPPGVPAPRLSIVAATQALPNVIGNAQRQQAAGNVSNVLGNALTNGFGLGNGLGNGVNLLNGFGRDDKNSNPGSPAKKAKIEETDEDDRLVIEEYWMGKENGQIEEIEGGKSEDEIEIESDMPCKVEPTEVETIQEISKEAFERTMAE